MKSPKILVAGTDSIDSALSTLIFLAPVPLLAYNALISTDCLALRGVSPFNLNVLV
jgi:hypothetical protein